MGSGPWHFGQALEGLEAADRDAAVMSAAVDKGTITMEQMAQVLEATKTSLLAVLAHAVLALAATQAPGPVLGAPSWHGVLRDPEPVTP